MRDFLPGVVALSLLLIAPQATTLAERQPAPRLLQPGDEAPAFELTGSDGRTYRLADYRGKQPVVLAWFARAFSAG